MALSTGLISGMDTGTLISQLVAAEGSQQAALKARLKTTELTASAYRTVNTTFLAVTAAAESALKPETWSSVKATSSATSVAVAAGPAARNGSLTFTVKSLAAAHSAVSTTSWSSATTPAAITATITNSLGAVSLDGTETLTEAAAKINESGLDLSAGVVQVRPGQFVLQLDSTKSGSAATFTTSGSETFKVTTPGKDAELSIGTDPVNAYSVYSDSNTFAGVMPGATITVGSLETSPVTVTVASDPDAVAAKVSAMVDAANAALNTVKTYTSNATGSTAALKGDFSVSSLAGRLQDAISFAVGSDGSPARIGFELTKDGKIAFDKAAFTAALKDTPGLASRMVGGTPAVGGVEAVPGIAQRLAEVTKAASDSTTGALVKLAEGQDSKIKDIQDRIDAWDLRLEKRREMLTRQFTAMETALSSLRNQSTWLAGQLNSLPSAG